MTKYMGDVSADFWIDDIPFEALNGNRVNMTDISAAIRTCDDAITICAVNKYDNKETEINIPIDCIEYKAAAIYTVNGKNKDDYNDIDSEKICITKQKLTLTDSGVKAILPPHSVNLIEITK